MKMYSEDENIRMIDLFNNDYDIKYITRTINSEFGTIRYYKNIERHIFDLRKRGYNVKYRINRKKHRTQNHRRKISKKVRSEIVEMYKNNSAPVVAKNLKLSFNAVKNVIREERHKGNVPYKIKVKKPHLPINTIDKYDIIPKTPVEIDITTNEKCVTKNKSIYDNPEKNLVTIKKLRWMKRFNGEPTSSFLILDTYNFFESRAIADMFMNPYIDIYENNYQEKDMYQKMKENQPEYVNDIIEGNISDSYASPLTYQNIDYEGMRSVDTAINDLIKMRNKVEKCNVFCVTISLRGDSITNYLYKEYASKLKRRLNIDMDLVAFYPYKSNKVPMCCYIFKVNNNLWKSN